MYFRVKRTGTYPYLQIVESFREKGQVHQRVLSTVGRLDVLQATGQLETLLRSGLRFCEKLAVIDAHAAGQTEPVTVHAVVSLGRGSHWNVSDRPGRRPAAPIDYFAFVQNDRVHQPLCGDGIRQCAVFLIGQGREQQGEQENIGRECVGILRPSRRWFDCGAGR